MIKQIHASSSHAAKSSEEARNIIITNTNTRKNKQNLNNVNDVVNPLNIQKVFFFEYSFSDARCEQKISQINDVDYQASDVTSFVSICCQTVSSSFVVIIDIISNKIKNFYHDVKGI